MSANALCGISLAARMLMAWGGALTLLALGRAQVFAECSDVDPRSSASGYQGWCRCIGGTPFLNGGNWACKPPSGGAAPGAGGGNSPNAAWTAAQEEATQQIMAAEQQRLADEARQAKLRFERLSSGLKLDADGPAASRDISPKLEGPAATTPSQGLQLKFGDAAEESAATQLQGSLQSCTDRSASRDRCFTGCDSEPTLEAKLACTNRCNHDYKCVMGYDCK